MTLDDLATPALLVEQRRLRANLTAMQETANDSDVALRPHVKTHKSVAIARKQQERGARGITVAKPAEAEVFAQAGFEDVRVAYPVMGRDKWQRLLDLTDRAEVSFCVDTAEGIRGASDFFAEREHEAPVLLEIDTGHRRTGVPFESDDEAVELAQLVNDSPGLRLAGILTHAGHGYHGPQSEDESETEALQRVAREERDRMLAVANRLREAGVNGATPGELEISVGSTPTMAAFENRTENGFRVTEIRPGNYVFYDAMQVALGAASLDDCALTVFTTVVSRRRSGSGAERLYLDAGKKVLTTDTGYGTDGYGVLLYNAQHMRRHPHARITQLSEEHGWVKVPGGAAFGVGDRVRLVPNHACVVAGMADELHLVDGQDVTGTLNVDARGASR